MLATSQKKSKQKEIWEFTFDKIIKEELSYESNSIK